MGTNLMRRILSVAISAGLLISVAACGAKPSNSALKADGANITTWMMTDKPWDPQKDATKEWNSANPNAKITYESFANDAYKEKIRTAVGSGNAPSFFPSWGGSPLRDYVKTGVVQDLSSELDSAVKDKIFPSIADEGYIDGKLYAVPTGQAQPVLIFYNKKVFKEAGINKDPETWDELVAAVAKLKAAGKTPIALAGGSKWPYLMWAAYLVDRIAGPEAFNAVLEGKKDAWSNPAIIKAMSMIQDLVKAGAFGNNYSSLTADDRKDTSLVATGNAGMELMGSWVYSDLISINKDFTKTDLGFMPFPTVSGGKGDVRNLTGNLSSYWQLSNKASAKQKKTFVDFYSKMNYSDKMVKSMLEQGQVPPVKGIDDQIKAADDGGEYYQWIYNSVKNAPAYQLSWDVALPSVQGQAVLNNLEQVFLLQISPQAFADAMNKTLQ